MIDGRLRAYPQFTRSFYRCEIQFKMCMSGRVEGGLRIPMPRAASSSAFRVWLLSLGVVLAPELSGNLNVILFHDCLGFQEGWNVPRVILCASNNLTKVCVSGPQIGHICLENLV